MTKKIPLTAVPVESECNYPSPFDRPCLDQSTQRLARHAGLTQFGVNLTVIEPGAWSSQRHWHTGEDEFVYVLSGEVTLVTDAGEELLRAGDAAGFKANDGDGHCLQNRSAQDVQVLEIGTRVPDSMGYYSDIDMIVKPGTGYTHRDGTPYPKAPRRGA